MRNGPTPILLVRLHPLRRSRLTQASGEALAPRWPATGGLTPPRSPGNVRTSTKPSGFRTRARALVSGAKPCRLGSSGGSVLMAFQEPGAGAVHLGPTGSPCGGDPLGHGFLWPAIVAACADGLARSPGASTLGYGHAVGALRPPALPCAGASGSSGSSGSFDESSASGAFGGFGFADRLPDRTERNAHRTQGHAPPSTQHRDASPPDRSGRFCPFVSPRPKKSTQTDICQSAPPGTANASPGRGALMLAVPAVPWSPEPLSAC
jgi:hypothetical protein